MSLIVFEQASLSLGGKSIIEDLDLRIAHGERIGLIGPNGSGKTTLLRMMTGEQLPDGGVVRRQKGSRVGYLPQDVSLEGGRTLLAFVVESVPGRSELQRDIAQAEQELERARAVAPEAQDDGHQSLLLELGGRIAELNERLAHFDTEFSPHRAKRILGGLGFHATDHDRDLGELSGGWRMRALLASLLFQRPDLLLLDEPTNHLDMPSVAWLSGFLRQYDQAFVLISHDREFLNEQISRVVSFEPEGIRSYNGNYDQYRRQREEELEILEARAKNLERERQQAQRFIDRFRAKASKASQVQSRIKQLEKMETVELPERRSSIRFRFPPTERIGRIAIRGEGLVKAYGEHVVLGGVDVQVERGDRIAIIGANGAGKTTLLRILGGEMTPDQGEVHYGNRVKLGYYAQHHAEALPRNATVYDAVVKRCPDEDRTRTRAALGAMHMRDDDVEKPVRVLSGGERARVALAQMLVDPGNVLLMDEPTNHLDLDSSERIAEALDTFDGTLVFVSHNRRFLRGLANKIWHVDSKGVEVYPGTLDEYMHSIRQDLQQDAPPETRAATARAADGAQGQAAETETASRSRDEIKARKRREAELRAERKRRLEPLRKRVRELEARIAELEKAQSERAELLSDPALYEDPERRDRVLAEHGKAAEEIESLTAQWMESQQELEEAEGALQQE